MPGSSFCLLPSISTAGPCAAPLALRPLPVDKWLRFLGTTTGRDKVYRTIQYFSRFLGAVLAKAAASGKGGRTEEAIRRLSALAVAVGLGRKRTVDSVVT